MARAERIVPREGYVYKPNTVRIVPRADYHPLTLHTRQLPPNSRVKSIEADWCPICHHRDIGEQVKRGKVLWHCNECGYEW